MTITIPRVYNGNPLDEVVWDAAASAIESLDTSVSRLTPSFARKLADETVNNSATLQDDDELLLAVEASAVYEMQAVVDYTSNTTPDLKAQWSFPTGLTMRYSFTGTVGGAFAHFTNDQTTLLVIDGLGSRTNFELKGIVRVSTTAGSLRFRWAQNTANASNTTVHADSYFRLIRVA